MTSSTQITVPCVTSTPSCFLLMSSTSSLPYMDTGLSGWDCVNSFIQFITLNITSWLLLLRLWNIEAAFGLFVEILCSSGHLRVSVRRPGPRSLFGDAAHAVRHHDRWPCSVSAEVPARKMCFPGCAGVWHTLLDVLHPPRSYREVRATKFIFNDHLYGDLLNWVTIVFSTNFGIAVSKITAQYDLIQSYTKTFSSFEIWVLQLKFL